MICKSCSIQILESQLVCAGCGAINSSLEINDTKLRDEVLAKLHVLSGIIKSDTLDNAYLWNDSVSKYAKRLEKVKALLQVESMQGKVSSKTFKSCDMLLKRCQSPELHIALIGTIKAGKSTLINALLGSELASTRVTPETAALTKFRSSKNGNYVQVSFWSDEEWAKLYTSAQSSKAEVFLDEYKALNADAVKSNWVGKSTKTIADLSKGAMEEEIRKWTSSKSAEHYFVKEVMVGIADFAMPPEVIFVDTPGLDDIVEFRSNITRDYIDRANAVLVCVKADALTGSELKTIFSVFSNTRYNPEKVFIIATQLDSLNRPEAYWQEQRVEWLKRLKSDECFANTDLAERNLIPVSAHLYSLLNHHKELRENDQRYFDLESILPKFRIRMNDLGEHFTRLIDFTGIKAFERKLKVEVIDKHNQIVLEDIKDNYQIYREELHSLMKSIKNTQEGIIATSQQDIQEIRAKRSICETELQDAMADKTKLEKFLAEFKLATGKRVDELTSAIMKIGG